MNKILLHKLELINSRNDVNYYLTANKQRNIVIDEPWFLRADFDRAGPDLVIKGPDGQVVVIRDYFNQIDPPDIRTPDGVVLKGETASILAGPRTDVELAQAQEIAQVEPIGTVETVQGGVSVTRANGTKVILKAGDPVFQGDVLETDGKGAVGIVFADESAFSLGESGRMVLDEMIYDPAAQQGKAAISMLQGAFTFVSGQIAKTGVDAMVVETPTATIGIRGTAGGGGVNAQGQMTIAIANERGQIVGEVTITNAGGSQTINQAFQALSVGSRDAAPSQPFVMTASQFGQAFGSAMKSLPNAENHLPPAVLQEATQAFEKQQETRQQAAQAEQQKEQKQTEAQDAKQAEQAAKAEAQAAAQQAEGAKAEADAAAAKAAEAQAAAAAAAAAAVTPEQQAAAEAAKAEAAAAVAAAARASAAAEAAVAQSATKEAEAAQAGAEAAQKQAEAASASVAAAQAKSEALKSSPESAVASAADAAGIQTHQKAAVEKEQQAAQQEVQQAQAAEKESKQTAESKQAEATAKAEVAKESQAAAAAAAKEAKAVVEAQTQVAQAAAQNAGTAATDAQGAADAAAADPAQQAAAAQGGEAIADAASKQSVPEVGFPQPASSSTTPSFAALVAPAQLTSVVYAGLENISAILSVDDVVEAIVQDRIDDTTVVLKKTSLEGIPTTYIVENETLPILDLDGGIDIVLAAVGAYTLPDEIENLTFLAQEPVEKILSGLQAQYYINVYNGVYAEKAAYMQTIDSNIDFYGYFSDINGNNNLPLSSQHGNEYFAVNWQGIIRSPTTGWVNFYASHDDGARLMINNEYIFNNWSPQGSHYYNSSGQYYMEIGKTYKIQAEMFENGGGDVMRLFWQYDNTSIHIINADFFFHTSTEIVNYIGYGNSLNNTMQGNDNGGMLYGLEGNDTLIGGVGADTLYGGSGSDVFVFNRASKIEDTIMDWMIDDKIDFSEITNNVNYIGDKQFSGREGEVRFNTETQKLELDVDADSQTDLNINVAGYSSTVESSDFNISTFFNK